jgi:hypothetical protein
VLEFFLASDNFDSYDLFGYVINALKRLAKTALA